MQILLIIYFLLLLHLVIGKVNADIEFECTMCACAYHKTIVRSVVLLLLLLLLRRRRRHR